MIRIFIVHRWYGSPKADWYPWLKNELEKKGFAVFVPAMPNPAAPEIKSWVKKLSDEVGTPDSDTYFVGHSVGCQTILRYLETLPKNVKIGGAVFVAGWFSLTPEATPSKKEQDIAKPWIEIAVSIEKVRQHTNNFIAIFSDNDPYVPRDENTRAFERFGAKTIVEHDKGHYDEDSKTFELPSALNSLLSISKSGESS